MIAQCDYTIVKAMTRVLGYMYIYTYTQINITKTLCNSH